MTAQLFIMHTRGAREALDALDDLAAARVAFGQAITAVTERHHGPQGVSSDCRFRDEALALFDAHVAHLVARHVNAVHSKIKIDPEAT